MRLWWEKRLLLFKDLKFIICEVFFEVFSMMDKVHSKII